MDWDSNPLLAIDLEDEDEEEVIRDVEGEGQQTESEAERGAEQQDQTLTETLTLETLNEDFLRVNGFDVFEYLDKGMYGTVYSAIANELAIKFYPIDQIPEGGVIGENVWQSGNQFYVQRSLTGLKVAIKHIPPPQLQPWDDPQEELDNQLMLGVVGGFIGLHSSDFPERIGHPLEEVRKLIRLSHPNLVEIYNVLSDEENNVYVVMEYLEMSLKNWVKGMTENSVSLDDNSIDIFLGQIISGLSYLHRNNITHNDLHSGNVMVTEDEEGCILMKFVDFGMSEYFSVYNSPAADIKGLGQLLGLVMTLLESDHPVFKQALEDFIYTCAKGVFSNMNEVEKEYESMKHVLRGED